MLPLVIFCFMFVRVALVLVYQDDQDCAIEGVFLSYWFYIRYVRFKCMLIGHFFCNNGVIVQKIIVVFMSLLVLGVACGNYCCAIEERKEEKIQEWFKAVTEGNVRAVQRLIADGIDPNIQLRGNNAALLLVAHKGNEEMVRVLVRHKADINQESVIKHQTPLTMAVTYGSVKMVQLLIALCASIDHQTSLMGQTALHKAACQGRPEMTRLLLRSKANQYLKDNDNHIVIDCAYRALFHAITRNKRDAYEQIVKLLRC